MAHPKEPEPSAEQDERQPMPPRVRRQLAVMLPETARWQQRLEEAIRQKRSGWHRLNVRIDRGAIKEVQIVLHEGCTIPDADAPEQEEDDDQ